MIAIKKGAQRRPWFLIYTSLVLFKDRMVSNCPFDWWRKIINFFPTYLDKRLDFPFFCGVTSIWSIDSFWKWINCSDKFRTFNFLCNINIHRTLILIEFEENGEATIVWAGSHDDYEMTFKNNRNVIKKWLRDINWI